jgi:hypothetical protein
MRSNTKLVDKNRFSRDIIEMAIDEYLRNSKPAQVLERQCLVKAGRGHLSGPSQVDTFAILEGD